MFTESPFQVCWHDAGQLEPGTHGMHRLLGCHCRIGGLSKRSGRSESIARGLASTEIYLKKVRKTVSKMIAVAVDQWPRHRCLRSQGTLGHAWRTVWIRGALPAALREHAEIMQGETVCCFAHGCTFCYQMFGRLFIYQGQGLVPHDISVLNGGNVKQSQD